MRLEAAEAEQISETTTEVRIVHCVDYWVQHGVGVAEPEEKFRQHLEFALAEEFALFLQRRHLQNVDHEEGAPAEDEACKCR